MNTLEATNASLALRNLRPSVADILIRGGITFFFLVISGMFFVVASPDYAPQVCASKPSPTAFTMAIMFLVGAVGFHFMCEALIWERNRPEFEILQTFIDGEIKRRDFPDHILRLCQKIHAESAKT